jgi:transposase
MKFVKRLGEAEQRTLLDALRYASWPRFRQRAHAVLLSGKGYRLAQLANIFEVDRGHGIGLAEGLVKQYGLLGLRDQEHSGRPRKGTEADREWQCKTIQGAAPASGLVRAFLGTNGVRCVTGHDAALVERTGLAVETLPPESEGKAW